MTALSSDSGHHESRPTRAIGEIKLRLPTSAPQLNGEAAIALLRVLRKAAACQQIARDTTENLDSQAMST